MKDSQREATLVRGADIQLAERVVRGSFRMLVPVDFAEDKNLVSNYTYLFSQDQSPLSIAIKHTPVANEAEKERQIGVYFSKAPDVLTDCTYGATVYHRETVTDSKYLSIYSLRFAVEVADGLLFGCFNCATADKDDWQPVVLKMLGTTEMI